MGKTRVDLATEMIGEAQTSVFVGSETRHVRTLIDSHKVRQPKYLQSVICQTHNKIFVTLVNKSNYHVCKCPKTCTIYPNKHTKCPGKATYNKSSDFSPTKVSKQCTHHLIRYVRSPLVLLRRLCLQKVYEGCSGWTYWSWRRVHGMLLLLLLFYF